MLKKDYAKNGKTCAVTFILPAAAVGSGRFAHLVGDFNNWERTANPMERQTDGSWICVIKKLEAGKEYQFRYLVDGERWENDWNADKYVPTPYRDAENSVVMV